MPNQSHPNLMFFQLRYAMAQNARIQQCGLPGIAMVQQFYKYILMFVVNGSWLQLNNRCESDSDKRHVIFGHKRIYVGICLWDWICLARQPSSFLTSQSLIHYFQNSLVSLVLCNTQIYTPVTRRRPSRYSIQIMARAHGYWTLNENSHQQHLVYCLCCLLNQSRKYMES